MLQIVAGVEPLSTPPRPLEGNGAATTGFCQRRGTRHLFKEKETLTASPPASRCHLDGKTRKFAEK
jgi:hypothetical protein